MKDWAYNALAVCWKPIQFSDWMLCDNGVMQESEAHELGRHTRNRHYNAETVVS